MPRSEPSRPADVCHRCSFLPRSEMRSLDAAGVARLQSAHVALDFPTGSHVFRAGSPCRGVYVLTHGLVAIRRATPEGDSMIVRLLFPVCTFDLATFLRAERHASEAYVLTPSRICQIDQPTFDQLVQDHPEVGRALMRRLATELATAEENLLALGRMPVRERFLRLLLQIGGQCNAHPAAATQRFTLPLSRQDMAGVLGIRPETLTRTIQEVGSEGLVHIRQRDVEIPDTGSLLAAIAE